MADIAEPESNPETTLQVRLRRDAPDRGYLQTLAAQAVWSDEPLSAHAAPAPIPEPPPPPGGRDEATVPIYDGPGELEGRTVRLRAERLDSGAIRVLYPDGDRFTIGNRWIVRDGAGAPERALERALGAPFALALAARGVYLLHASAIALPGESVVAIVAPSGGGKSTLAAVARRVPLGLTRLADDQLPVRFSPLPHALPHFPQLKLAAAEQVNEATPPERPLGAVVDLRVSKEFERPALVRLSAAAALEILVGATVAARLFDRNRLAEHFAACSSAASSIPVYRLESPFGLERLPESLALIAKLAPSSS